MPWQNEILKMLIKMTPDGRVRTGSGRKSGRFTLALLLCIGLLQCPSVNASAEDTAVLAGSGNKINDLGLRVCKQLIPGDKKSNFLFSPLSFATTYGMCLIGAGGRTRAQMVELSGEKFPESVDSVSSNVLRRNSSSLKLTITNNVITDRAKHVLPEYYVHLDKLFGSTLSQTEDIGKATEQQVSQVSHGLLHTANASVAPNSLLLLNTVYLKAAWSDPFQTQATRPVKFTCGDGSMINPPTMQKSFLEEMKYCDLPDLEAVRLPYGSGTTVKSDQQDVIAMYVVVPKQASVNDWLAKLDDKVLSDILASMTALKGTLWLPRFQVENSLSFAQSLKKNGITDAFLPAAADFSAMAPPPCWLADITQNAKIATNEEGTEAAAETEALFPMGIEAAPPKTFEMKVNRSFVFVVRDDSTGAILFVGFVNKPIDCAISEKDKHQALLARVAELSVPQANGSDKSSRVFRLQLLGSQLSRQGYYSDALKVFQTVDKLDPASEMVHKSIAECLKHLGDTKRQVEYYQSLLAPLMKTYLTCHGHEYYEKQYIDAASKISRLTNPSVSEDRARAAAQEMLLKSWIESEAKASTTSPEAKRFLHAPFANEKIPAAQLQKILADYADSLDRTNRVNSKSLSRLKDPRNRDPKTYWCVGNIWKFPERNGTRTSIYEAQCRLARFYISQKRIKEAVPVFQFAVANAILDGNDNHALALLKGLSSALNADKQAAEASMVNKNITRIQDLLNQQTTLKRIIDPRYKPNQNFSCGSFLSKDDDN